MDKSRAEKTVFELGRSPVVGRREHGVGAPGPQQLRNLLPVHVPDQRVYLGVGHAPKVQNLPKDVTSVDLIGLMVRSLEERHTGWPIWLDSSIGLNS